VFKAPAAALDPNLNPARKRPKMNFRTIARSTGEVAITIALVAVIAVLLAGPQ
jgi:hypothetical protein